MKDISLTEIQYFTLIISKKRKSQHTEYSYGLDVYSKNPQRLKDTKGHTAASKRKEKEIENPNDLLDENMRKYRTMIDLNMPK